MSQSLLTASLMTTQVVTGREFIIAIHAAQNAFRTIAVHRGLLDVLQLIFSEDSSLDKTPIVDATLLMLSSVSSQ